MSNWLLVPLLVAGLGMLAAIGRMEYRWFSAWDAEESPWVPPDTLNEADWLFLRACWPETLTMPGWLAHGDPGAFQAGSAQPAPGPGQLGSQAELIEAQIECAVGGRDWDEARRLLYLQALAGRPTIDATTRRQIDALIEDKIRWYKRRNGSGRSLRAITAASVPTAGVDDSPELASSLEQLRRMRHRLQR